MTTPPLHTSIPFLDENSSSTETSEMSDVGGNKESQRTESASLLGVSTQKIPTVKGSRSRNDAEPVEESHADEDEVCEAVASGLENEECSVAATIKAARDAADFAHKAALSCYKTVDSSTGAIKIWGRTMDSTARKMDNSLPGTRRQYRPVQKKRRDAMTAVLKTALIAENSADIAVATSDNASICADALLEIQNEQSEACKNAQQQAIAAVNTAKDEARKAYEAKYLLLMDMKKGWDQFAYQGRSQSICSCKRMANYLLINLALMSFAALGAFVMFSPGQTSTPTYEMKATGTFFIVMYFIVTICQIAYCIYRRKMAKKERKPAMALMIKNELDELVNYFEREQIPLPS